MAFNHRVQFTFHLSVRFPLVVPSSKLLAVEFCTLGSSEANAVLWALLTVAEFQHPRGTFTEFSSMGWSKTVIKILLQIRTQRNSMGQ